MIDLLTTKYDDFDYSNWVAEFNVTVKTMLPQGLRTLGLFVYCENEFALKESLKKIEQLLNKTKAVEKDDDLMDSDDEI